MKISFYLINLDSSDERLQKADIELRKQQVEYIRIPAVDGRKLELASYANYESKKAHAFTGRDLIGAEIGCYLSHKKAVEAFLSSNADYGIVLEDDLSLTPDFKEKVIEIIQWLEKNNKKEWSVINLGAKKKKLSAKLAQFGQYELLHAYYFPILAIGLIWSKHGAQEFLTKISDQPIFMPIDVELQTWLSKNGKGLSVYPALVLQNGSDSDIDAGTLLNQGKSLRADKFFPRQKRMWTNKWNAFKKRLER
ncbi:glycosyltransferase family 25 protein [Acinetobacter haemolyticus]|uniref:Glycosyl transferase n=1 Tax=Acinetobacter haemolyticus TaxID=29430 RepID=A0AAJ3D7M0_ACIHA|nr:glycosyltransferase family 25 protein [Acinetobacter haemolyticus]NAR64328.1 glycosyl transferase [Acinetobacter haemolyticus]NAR72370.1 glycosyl transferase [Acinetobacter haemolyticus]